MTVAHWPGSVKPCPTCGREISGAADQCETCEVWAAALVDSRPASEVDASVAFDEVVEPVAARAEKTEVAPPASAAPLPASAAPPPVSAVPRPVSAAPAASRRRLIVGVAAAAVVVLLAAGMMAARGPSRAEARAAAPVAPAARVASSPPASAPTASSPTAAASAHASVPPSTTNATQKWNAEKKWLGGYRRGAAFELPAEDVVKTWFGPARPSLVVRCISHNIEAFVFTGSPMKIETRAAGKTVNLFIDDQAMQTERWPDSDDHDALFAPDGAAFAKRLLNARMLRFGYSPHNSPDVVAHFHVGGLQPLMTAAAKECAPKAAAR